MFKNQDEFIKYQISFSCNAFVSEETGWLEQIDEDLQLILWIDSSKTTRY